MNESANEKPGRRPNACRAVAMLTRDSPSYRLTRPDALSGPVR